LLRRSHGRRLQLLLALLEFPLPFSLFRRTFEVLDLLLIIADKRRPILLPLLNLLPRG